MKNYIIKIVSLLLFLTIISTLFVACSKEEDTPQNKLFTYYLEKSPVIIDPQVATDTNSQIVIYNTFEGLCKLDKDGKLIAGVAKDWSANEDFTEFTFNLRNDAKWSNGENVTAYDFEYGMIRAVSPDTKSQNSYMLYPIKNAEKIRNGQADLSTFGVKVVDNYTITISLEYSYKNFPYETIKSAYMPCNEQFFKESRGKYGMESHFCMSNGGFMLRTKYGWDRNSYLRLVKNQEYKGEDEVVPSGVYFKFGNSIDKSIELLTQEEGFVDASKMLASDSLKAEKNHINLFSYTDTVWGLTFNTQSNIFYDENIRKSFFYAIDREKVLQNPPVNTEFYSSIIPEDISYQFENYRKNAGALNLPQYNKDMANALLSTGLSSIGLKKLPSITLICLDDYDVKMIANNLVAQFKEAFGFYVAIEPLSQEDLTKRISTGNYQMAISNYVATSDNPTDCLDEFVVGGNSNITKYESAEFNQLLDNAKYGTQNNLESIKIAENYLVGAGVFYPMYSEKSYYGIYDNVENLVIIPFSGLINFFYAGKLDRGK